MSTKQGQFTLLLDNNFDIIWHSESLTPLLGWRDLCGRNGTEFVHPDDLELVQRADQALYVPKTPVRTPSAWPADRLIQLLAA